MSGEGQYGVTLTADTRGYDQNIRTSTGLTDRLGASLGAAATGIQNLTRSADRKLTFIAAGEVAAITGLTVAAGNLDSQMSQLQARQKLLGQDTNAYTGTVTKLRQEFGASSQDVINLVTQLNRLNVPFSQQRNTVAQYVKLSAVTGENVNALAQSQTSLMRTMQAQPQQVERYSAMFANLSQRMNVSAQGTMDFANSIAPMSQQLGMSTQQIAGISASFNKAGQDGYAAGNVYNRILSDINRSIQYGSPQVQVYADLIGRSVDDFKAMPKAEVVTDIFDALNRQGPQAIKTLERLGLEGVRSQRAIVAVAQQGGLRQGINEASAGWGNRGVQDFSSASKVALDGLNDNLGKTRETFSAFGQAVGGTFLPAAKALTGGLNDILAPVRYVTEAIEGMGPAGQKITTFVAAMGPLIALAPKIITALGAGALLMQVTRGSFGQGLSLGRNPGQSRSGAQSDFVQGRGNAGQRALFRGGMAVGDLLNPTGRRGRLDDIDFVDPDDPNGRMGYQSRIAALRDRATQGMIRAGVLPEDYQPTQPGANGPIRRGLIGAMQFGGTLARENLRPMSIDYQRSFGFNPNALTQESSFTNALRRRARNPFTQEGFEQNAANVRNGPDQLRQRYREMSEQITQVNKDWRAHRTVTANFFRELGRFGGSVGGAAAGGAYGVARGGASLVGRGIGSLVAAGGGPAGLALMGGTLAVGGLIEMRRRNRESDQNINTGGDVGAGSEYRTALGLAAKATTDFASIVKQNAGDLDKSVGTVAEAIRVTQDDITKASGQTGSIIDTNIKSASSDPNRIQSYVTTTLQGAGPQEANALKLDLVAKYGADAAQRLLDNGSRDRSAQSLAADINIGNQQSWLGERAFGTGFDRNRFTVSDANTEAGKRALGTYQTQLARINQNNGVEEGARYAQSRVSDVFNTALAENRSGEGAAATTFSGMNANPASRARYSYLRGLLNVDEDDKASREALQNVMDQIAGMDPTITGAARDRYIQSALTGGLANTQAGASLAQMRKAGGIYTGSNYTLPTDPSAYVLSPMGLMNQDERDQARQTSRAAGVTTRFGGTGAAQQIITAVNAEDNADAQLTARNAIVSGVSANNGGDWDKTIRDLSTLGNTALDASSPLRALYESALAAAKAQRDFANAIGGRGGIMGTSASALSDYRAAVTAYRGNPTNAGNREKVEGAQDTARTAALAINDRIQGMADQYRQLDIQREQGEAQMARSISRQQRDYGIAQSQALEDYNRSRERQQYNFSLQRERQEDEYNRSRSRGEDDYRRQQARGQEDFDRSRRRGEADFERGLTRQLRDRNIQLDRQQADYTKSRVRDEADYNTQVERMARDTAKSVYDIYSRTTVERTWSGGNLLQNMQDQQRRLDEQNTNLDQARQLGLSNDAISQLGLNDSSKAQQLSRMVQDLQDDPSLVKQYNQAVTKRTDAAGKLMRDASNSQFRQMEEDRAKALERQDADFAQSLARGNTDYQRSVNDARRDFQRAQNRSREDFERSLARSNLDYRRATARQNEDFRRGMKQSQQDFTRSMNQAASDFDLLRRRQRENMARGWADMRSDFDYQMDLQEKNISLFAEDTSKSFDDAYKTVSSRAQGETANQVKQMKELMKQLKEAVKTGVDDVDKEVSAPFKKWNIYKVGNSKNGTVYTLPNGMKIGTGGPGPNDMVPSADGAAGEAHGTGNPLATPNRRYATQSHSVNTPWGKRGSWSGSRTLGPGFHSGTDYKAATGDPIYAVADGVVRFAGNGGAYGNKTEIAHGKDANGNSISSWYAHQSSQAVRPGDIVQGGEVIGRAGSTGRVFPAGPAGAHLHLEIVQNGKDIDPDKWLKGASSSSGGGGGVEMDEETLVSIPDFANMASVKALNALLEHLDYFDSDGSPFSPGNNPLGKGQLADQLTNLYALRYQQKYGAATAVVDGGTGLSYGSGSADSGNRPGARGVWNALRSSGLTAKQTAGVMGNIEHESGFDPRIVQGGGHSNDPASTSNGYGLVQWTPGRKLKSYIGTATPTIENSIDALMKQLSGKGDYPEGAAGTRLRAAQSVMEATRAFMLGYERPADQSDGAVRRRNSSSEKWYGKFKGYAAGTTSAAPGWHWVGEEGPERVLFKGGEQVSNATQSQYAMMASKAGQVVRPQGSSITNNSYDHSTRVEGPITVQANDPKQLMRELQAEARFAAMTRPKAHA